MFITIWDQIKENVAMMRLKYVPAVSHIKLICCMIFNEVKKINENMINQFIHGMFYIVEWSC